MSYPMLLLPCKVGIFSLEPCLDMVGLLCSMQMGVLCVALITCEAGAQIHVTGLTLTASSPLLSKRPSTLSSTNVL